MITIEKDKLQNYNGFTLIEILAAITVITIGMFSIMAVIIMVIKGNAHSKRATDATTIAQDRMEDIFNMNFGSVTTSNTDLGGTYTYIPPYIPPYIVTDPGTSTYVLEMKIEDDTPDTNTKTITLDVYWNQATTTSAHKVELKTIIANIAN